jgi:hypothetical protein
MNTAAIVSLVTGIIGLITQLLPLFQGAGNSTAIGGVVNKSLDLIGQIVPLVGSKDSAGIQALIKTLQDMAPLVTDQIGVTYQGIKNIIASIGKHPASTEEQLATLRAFDKRVDDAWNTIEGQLDPDAPGAA